MSNQLPLQNSIHLHRRDIKFTTGNYKILQKGNFQHQQLFVYEKPYLMEQNTKDSLCEAFGVNQFLYYARRKKADEVSDGMVKHPLRSFRYDY